LGRFHWKQIAVILPVFLLASGPVYVLHIVESLQQFWWGYFSPPAMGQIVWPDAMASITEGQRLGIMATLRLTHGLLPVVFAGLAGLVYLCLRRFRQMIPIAPLLILGAWSLVGQIRFAMYLAPFIGIGVGVLIELLIRYVGKKTRLHPQLVPLTSVALMFTLFFSTTAHTGYGYTIDAIVPAPMTRAFLDIKGLVPKHSAMFTPTWDYGYPLMEIGEFATYHDGSQHGGIRTTLISKAVTSTEQEEMVSLLAYLEEYGFEPLSKQIEENNMTADRMLEMVFDYPGDFQGEKVYVLYLETMIGKFGPISSFGTWDFARRKSDPMRYENMTCFSLIDNILTCRGGKVDLGRGVIIAGTLEIPLRAVLFVNDGYVADRTDFRDDQGPYLQILKKNNQVFRVQVVDERLFRTNFNQQYLLGNYDRRYFEEVYNNFPVARVLKVKNSR
jgi:dolichyl-diphosphooligosaccharide--protein glycosyltransferase